MPNSQISAYMRATTSTAWMIGPAVTFLVADRFGVNIVFMLALITSLLAGPAVGLIAQAFDFQMVVRVASGVALVAAITLIASRPKEKITA